MSPSIAFMNSFSAIRSSVKGGVASPELIAVSKTRTIMEIEELYESGQRHFGENKLQELENKAKELNHLKEISWHFIGRVQSNKIRRILRISNWLHSLDSAQHLEKIERIAVEENVRPNLFLQINLENENSKAGFNVEEVLSSVSGFADFTQVRVVGLMCIPRPHDDPEEVRSSFRSLRVLRDKIEEKYTINLPYLSMGMSNDYRVAIEEGATHIRVGTALFGERKV